jgi:hypothetical protein
MHCVDCRKCVFCHETSIKIIDVDVIYCDKQGTIIESKMPDAYCLDYIPKEKVIDLKKELEILEKYNKKLESSVKIHEDNNEKWKEDYRLLLKAKDSEKEKLDTLKEEFVKVKKENLGLKKKLSLYNSVFNKEE